MEYALLIILALAAVYMMSPYVIRSWNANVKGFEDSYKDSYQDPLAQPFSEQSFQCHCDYVRTCATPPCCGMGSCSDVEDSEIFVCSPINCEAERSSICTPVPDCCSTPVPLRVPDACGTLGCKELEVPALYYCGVEDPDNPPHVRCQFNQSCRYKCFDPPEIDDPFYAKRICPHDNINVAEDTEIIFVEHGGCSPPEGSAPKCQWECAEGFVPSEKGNSCDCPKGFVRQEDQCVLKVLADVRGDCYSDTPGLDKIDGIPGCYSNKCIEAACDFENKTLFSVGDQSNFTPDAYFFKKPDDWKIRWSGDECDVISGGSGNWCQMIGQGKWNVTAWITHLPTKTNLRIDMKGVDLSDFSCRGCP